MQRLLIIACGCAVAVGGGAIALANAAAGDPTDLAACELHVRSILPAGVGYRRVGVTRVDSGPLTPAAFHDQAGPPASRHGLGEAERLQRILDDTNAEAGDLALRRMILTYQLDGDPVPRQQICAFRLIEGKLESAEILNAHATTVTGRALDVLADIQGRARQSRPKYTCCL